MTLKVTIDRDSCMACGVAPTICSDVFILEKKNRVIDKYTVELTESLSVGEVPDELKECVESAVDSCPVNAIKMEQL